MSSPISERCAAHVAAHLASAPDEHVAGWLVGVRESDCAPVLLGALRCLHYAARAPRAEAAAVARPDWAREGDALRALLPVGVSVIGYYASVVVAAESTADALAATPAARAAAFFDGAPRGDATWPSSPGDGPLLVALGAARAPAETAAVHVGRADLGDPASWRACDTAALDAAAVAWLRGAALVRASARLPVRVRAEAPPRWRGACTEAFVEAERMLSGDELCFTVVGAPALGVYSLGGRRDAPAGGGTVTAAMEALCALAPAAARADARPEPAAAQRVAPERRLMLELVWDVTPASFEAGARAPVLVAVPTSSVPAAVTFFSAELEACALCAGGAALGEVGAALRDALRAQLRRLLVDTLGAAAGVDAAPAAGARLRGCTFESIVGHAAPPAFHAEYLLPAAGADATEASARPARAALHARLGLPTDRPLLRTANALAPAGAPPALRATRLVNVHEHCPQSGVKGGMLAVVRGSYEYYHYMQDNFDDKGWGCAYRSLMTIISWYVRQQYTQQHVPMHAEIQSRLVGECAQPAALLNSRKWIGALDVSLFLEVALGVTCRIENFSTGAELAQKGRLLLRHFETQGTPVMMGGGELAYTLLGVHFDDKSGDIRFLILDPHYTGRDDLDEIVAKKWCGWHTADKFAKNAFYNLCFPLCPDCI